MNRKNLIWSAVLAAAIGGGVYEAQPDRVSDSLSRSPQAVKVDASGFVDALNQIDVERLTIHAIGRMKGGSHVEYKVEIEAGSGGGGGSDDDDDLVSFGLIEVSFNAAVDHVERGMIDKYVANLALSYEANAINIDKGRLQNVSEVVIAQTKATAAILGDDLNEFAKWDDAVQAALFTASKRDDFDLSTAWREVGMGLAESLGE